MNGRNKMPQAKWQIRYIARRAACGACSLRAGCLTEKAKLRTVYRWERDEVIERHLARMQHAGALTQPPRRFGRASLRHAEMPRWLPAFLARRLRKK